MKTLIEWTGGVAFGLFAITIAWRIPPFGCPDIFWWMR
jgi:hypothetical protein